MSDIRVCASFVGTAAQFATANRTLLTGELGYETDTKILKFGDGVTAWNSLPAWTAGVASVVSVNGNTGVVVLTKASLGLGSVDNTADADKPVSTAQATAIGLKANKAGDTFTGPIVVEGDFNGTGYTNLKSQNTDPTTPASGVAVFADTNEMFSFKGQSGYKASLNDQNLTSERQFDLPDQDGTLISDPTTTDGDIIYRNNLGLQRLGSGGPSNEDWLYSVDSNGRPYLREENLGQDFGGGSDGNVTLTGVLTLTNPAYYNTLTMGPGGAIITNGYPLYAKTLDLSNCNVGCIQWNGNNGNNTATQTGASAGTALAATMLGGSLIGGAGATSVVSTPGAIGTAGTQASPSNGGASGAGGAGGAGTAGAGGALRAGASALNFIKFDRFEQGFFRGAALIVGGAGGSGGSSGSGAVGTGRGGGGGGSGGGVVAVYCQTLITSASTPAGAIQALGGNGGSCTGTPSADAGGGGGGGGAGGGYIYFSYLSRVGPVVTNIMNATGGNGGNGGVGSSGASVAGQGGAGGAGGRIRIYNAETATSVSSVGVAGSAGTLASGIVPGLGGSGGPCQASL